MITCGCKLDLFEASAQASESGGWIAAKQWEREKIRQNPDFFWNAWPSIQAIQDSGNSYII